MRFIINQGDLSDIVSAVQKGASARSILPIYSGVLIETSGDDVVFQTTDGDLSIRYTSPALVEEPGRAVLPAKILGDIVKSLPDAAVTIKSEDMSAIITCESSSISIKGLNPEDFPAFPVVEEEASISIPFEKFSQMAKKVCRMVSRDESRPILTGVLVAVEEGLLRMVATDSYRLAVSQTPFEGDMGDFQVVISGSFLSELAGLPKTGEDVSIAVAENQVVITYGGMVFVNRRIEGKYPNYKQLLPNNFLTRVSVDRQQLLAAVKRTALLDRSGTQVRFSVNAETSTVQLSSTTQDVGSIQDTVKAGIEGEDVEIGFNSYYVSEGLSALESEEVYLDLQGSMKQGVFKGSEEEGYLYVVMPVRL